MPLDLSLDTARIDWVTFRPDPDDPLHPRLSAYGTATNDAGREVPCSIEGWDGVSEATRTVVEKALLTLACEVAARELTLQPGEGLVFAPGGVFRQSGEGEAPMWVQPARPVEREQAPDAVPAAPTSEESPVRREWAADRLARDPRFGFATEAQEEQR
jgi:hypothetical protein